MRARPLWVFMVIAALMVGWLSVRMWFGELPRVWAFSCLLGAWAPLATAVIFTYIREAGRREDGVLAAWLVRAIGMHCVLVWLLGINDYLRGPPGLPPQWNTDIGMPVVLLAFAPVFALSVAMVSWIQRVSRRLDPPPLPLLQASVKGLGVIPYRGNTLVASPVAPVGRSWVPFAVGAAGTCLALSSSFPSTWILFGSIGALALVTAPRSRAPVPCIGALIAVAGLIVARVPMHTPAEMVSIGVVWPCLAFGATVAYLLLVEVKLWVRAVAVRS